MSTRIPIRSATLVILLTYVTTSSFSSKTTMISSSTASSFLFPTSLTNAAFCVQSPQTFSSSPSETTITLIPYICVSLGWLWSYKDVLFFRSITTTTVPLSFSVGFSYVAYIPNVGASFGLKSTLTSILRTSISSRGSEKTLWFLSKTFPGTSTLVTYTTTG